jgi:hypothetical protein
LPFYCAGVSRNIIPRLPGPTITPYHGKGATPRAGKGSRILINPFVSRFRWTLYGIKSSIAQPQNGHRIGGITSCCAHLTSRGVLLQTHDLILLSPLACKPCVIVKQCSKPTFTDLHFRCLMFITQQQTHARPLSAAGWVKLLPGYRVHRRVHVTI